MNIQPAKQSQKQRKQAALLNRILDTSKEVKQQNPTNVPNAWSKPIKSKQILKPNDFLGETGPVLSNVIGIEQPSRLRQTVAAAVKPVSESDTMIYRRPASPSSSRVLTPTVTNLASNVTTLDEVGVSALVISNNKQIMNTEV